MKSLNSNPTQSFNRRQFLGGTLAAMTAAPLASLSALAQDQQAPAAAPKEFARKIKVGVIGNGGRGAWIAKLFQQHGGYELHAVADYFPEVADKCGEELGVDKSRRFSTLSGYKRLLESGVQAVVIETPPYFLPEHASAAVAAGLHVYMAKPVAVDVPGCLRIEKAAAEATGKGRCFLVDYQMPTDPVNQEVWQRLHAPGFGKIAGLTTIGGCSAFADPPLTANLESRLRNLIWVNDIAFGCDYIGNFDIHAIDAALWVAGQRPSAACGSSRICRPDPHGDAHDMCAVTFEYADGLVHSHVGHAFKNFETGELSCRVHGQSSHALLTYWGKASVRSSDDAFGGEVKDLYAAGVNRNIATFYQNVTQQQCANGTVRRAVDGALACILGREAAARHTWLTMAALLQENKALVLDLKGLKS